MLQQKEYYEEDIMEDINIKKFAYNISQWITLYRFLLEHYNYEEAKKAGVSKRAKELGRKFRDKKKIIKVSKIEKLVGIEWTYEECADLMNLFAGGVVEYTQLYEEACKKISQLENEINNKMTK